jgi:hypothetical protein
VSPEERRRAVEAIGALRGTYVPPDELGALIDEGRLAAVVGADPR